MTATKEKDDVTIQKKRCPEAYLLEIYSASLNIEPMNISASAPLPRAQSATIEQILKTEIVHCFSTKITVILEKKGYPTKTN